MNAKWKLLTLTALLSAGCSTASADDTQYDEDAYFGDSASYAQSLYDDEPAYDAQPEAAPSEDFIDPELQPVAFVGDEPAYHSPNVGSGIQAMPASHQTGAGCTTGDCGSTVAPSSDCGCSTSTSCGGSCGTTSSMRMKSSCGSSPETWMTAEALLWFPQVRDSTIIATEGPNLNTPGPIATAFGGQNSIGDDLAAGFRIDGGQMLTDNLGVGGRFWWLGEVEDTFARPANAPGNTVLVPFFDTTAGADTFLKVNFDDGLDAAADPRLNADFAGSLNSSYTLDMYGAEAYGKLRLLSGRGYSTDFVGGFSHFTIEENFNLAISTIQTDLASNNAIPNFQGDTFDFADAIEAENTFLGGSIGFATTVNRGQWQMSALTKVHLGNMEQVWQESGFRTRTFNGGAATSNEGGIFTAGPDRNQTNDEFVFAPEANIKLSYQFQPHVRFSVGYSFIMWSDVLMIGENLDPNVNGAAYTTGLNGASQPNAFGVANRSAAFTTLDTDSFFVQGIDLGCVINF